jgi:hypothetical protein
MKPERLPGDIGKAMAAAIEYEHEPELRGATKLLNHCALMERMAAGKPTARTRLDRAVGADLAALLVFALVDQRPRPRAAR